MSRYTEYVRVLDLEKRDLKSECIPVHVKISVSPFLGSCDTTRPLTYLMPLLTRMPLT